jgi:c-di-GMP-binding flagellar brake protein YcgR
MEDQLEGLLRGNPQAEKCTLKEGMDLLVRIKGVSQNQKSKLVAFGEDSFVAVKITRLLQVASKLFKGNQVDVSYFHEGKITGFQSQIIDHISRPFPMLFLTYPSFFAHRDLRARPRVNCCLPARVLAGEKSWEGLLLNISTTGCRFVFRTGPDVKPPKFMVDDEFQISFLLNERMGGLRAGIQVKNRTRTKTGGLTIMGAQFTTLDDRVDQAIGLYVREALAHLVDLVQEAEFN